MVHGRSLAVDGTILGTDFPEVECFGEIKYIIIRALHVILSLIFIMNASLSSLS